MTVARARKPVGSESMRYFAGRNDIKPPRNRHARRAVEAKLSQWGISYAYFNLDLGESWNLG